ncbi:hypothetical protein DGG96_09465 [Legionella qingyii]|uniref:Uncharacterized protein n=1 Tax=Legionella qingyii TaxID=2184757 RepID=A0A317U627_9GAMM|nr:hypothetical protein DGG96_09465 [Legionella qingyii]
MVFEINEKAAVYEGRSVKKRIAVYENVVVVVVELSNRPNVVVVKVEEVIFLITLIIHVLHCLVVVDIIGVVHFRETKIAYSNC